MNNMKNAIYGNQGHLIPDFFCTGISRVYVEDGNLIIVIQTTTGIETATEIYLNEVARLIIPKSKINEIGSEVSQAIKYAIELGYTSTDEGDQLVVNNNGSKNEELGQSLGIF